MLHRGVSRFWGLVFAAAVLFGATACSTEPETGSTGAEKLRHSRQRLTLATEFQLRVPAGSRLHDVVIGASQAVRVEDGVVVEPAAGDAPVFVTSTGLGESSLGSTATVEGHVLSTGPVSMRDRATVTGDLKTEGEFRPQNVYTIGGSLLAGATLTPVSGYAWEVTFPDPGAPVALEPDQVRDLFPGSYGTVAVKSRSRLRLAPGVYYFSSLQAESGSAIELTGSDAPVIVYVRDAVSFGRGSIQGTAASERLFLGYWGAQLADIDAPFRGTIVAPNAALRLSPVDGSGHEGSFFAKTIDAGARNPIRHRPFGYWDHLMPPVLTVECVSRSARGWGAGLFGYENKLDVPVTIAEGPRNQLAADLVKTQPLRLFEPGKHERAYWVTFRGPALTWLLGGNATQVDQQARGCTLEDYRLVPPTVVAQGPPDDMNPAIGFEPVELVDPVPFQFVDPSTLNQQPPPQTTTATGTFTVRLFGMGVGGEGIGGEYDVDGEVIVNGHKIVRKLWDGIWRGAAQGVPIIDELYTFEVPTDLATVRVDIDLWERDTLGDDNEIRVNLDVDNRTGAQTVVGHTNGDGENIDVADNCGQAGDGWSICWEIVPSAAPRVCADWFTQYADSGFGEDIAGTRDLQRVPASFTHVRLQVTGGVEPFSGWSHFFPLDADGCVPPEFTPSFRQLMRPDPSSAGPVITMELSGAITNQHGAFVVANDANQAFVASQVVSPITMEQSWTQSGAPPAMIRFPLNALNEFTKAAAAASRLMALHATGVDMGLLQEVITIKAQSSAAVQAGSPFQSNKEVHLRPADSVALPISDATFKNVIGHEVGHAMQRLAVGEIFLGYSVQIQQPDGSISTQPYPPATPPECRCDHVQHEFSDLHCIQSLEPPNAAQTEGFAHFYAARTWNDVHDADCWFPYVKWVLAPECPSYEDNEVEFPVRCVDARNPPADVAAKLQGLPDPNELDPTFNWVLVEPPVVFSCAFAAKWRNNYCVDATSTPDVSFFGVELDWQQFFYGLTTPGDPGSWTVTDTFLPYRAVCAARGVADADGRCMPGDNPATPAIEGNEALMMDWDTLSLSGVSSLSVEKQNRFRAMGDAFGVSRSLAR